MPSELAEIGTALGSVLVVAIVFVIRSARSGKIRDALENRNESKELGKSAHKKIDDRIEDIHKTTKDTDAKVDSLSNQVTDLAEAVVVLHADDPGVNQEALRERVGVEDMASDIRSRSDD